MNIQEASFLLVDDEPFLLEIYSAWLQLAGCRKVRTACNGEVALSAVTSEAVDLLITDIRMPVMNGTTLVRELSKLTSPTPSILFISGFGDIESREMYSLGVEAFLSKPLERGELIEQVERSLAHRSQLWSTAMMFPPRQRMEVTVEGDEEGVFRWGRGGFCARSPRPLSVGKLAFRCHFSSSNRYLSGEGHVRWYSETDQVAGIELSYLEPTSHAWASRQIEALRPRSYIPTPLYS